MNPLEVALLLALVVAAVGLGLYWRATRLRQLSRDRLQDGATEAVSVRDERVFPTRYRWVPPLLGLTLATGLYLFAPLGAIFPASFGLIVFLLGFRVEAWWAAQRRLLIESQLADALDLMIGTLRAGASVLVAIEAAARESRSPLRGQLEELLGRIRYGDDPQAVLGALVNRVPLETFRLFGAALSVHWEVGGSLAPVLATVARTVRDRIDLSRRVSAMTSQARLSIFAVLGVTYFIAAAVWRNDPGRMEAFLSTSIGQWLVALTLLLQAAGIVWASVLTRMRGM
jgi:Flp pilus assembly protein TadB